MAPAIGKPPGIRYEMPGRRDRERFIYTIPC